MLQTIIREKMFAALKAKDKRLKDAYSMILNELKNKEIALLRELTEQEEVEVIAKMVKQAKEAIACIPNGTNQDFVADREFEISVYSEFLPEQMSDDEIKNIILETMKENGIDIITNQTKGLLMKNLMPKVKGKADGKLVASIVAAMM